MKKIMIFLLITVLSVTGISVGCTANDDSPVTEEENMFDEKADNEQILEEFRTLVAEADFPKSVVDYADEIVIDLDTETASVMIFELSQYLSEFFNYDTKMWDNMERLNVYYDYSEGIDEEKIKETDVKEFYYDLIDSGYKLVAMEGMLNPIVDYRWMAKYNEYISEDISDYFELCAIESDQLSAKDAALVISWDELGDRVLAAEKFLSEHSGSVAKGEVLYRYTRYLWMYMLGLNNTPTVEWETNKVKEEVLDSYNKFIEEHNDTISAEAVGNYIKLLSEIQFIIPYDNEEKYLDFDRSIDELIDNAKNSL